MVPARDGPASRIIRCVLLNLPASPAGAASTAGLRFRVWSGTLFNRGTISSLAIALFAAPLASGAQVMVTTTVETDPVPSNGDAADDPAVWVHATDAALSVVLGTDKGAGIAVYDLDGLELQFDPAGELNNVDVRYGFSLNGELVDIAAASNRTDDSIAIFKIDPATGLLTDVALGSGISVGITVYGFCLYASASGDHYAFVNSKDGEVEQWQLRDDGAGLVDGTLMRSFDVGGQTEGCVADDRWAHFYIGEEDTGIWRYGAEPGDGTTRVQVDHTGTGGNLVADVEGLTLYAPAGAAGYLIASSQGDDSFVLYERGATNAFVGRFTIGPGVGIDAVSETDGIDVVNVALSTGFPNGFFVAQDGANHPGHQNYKLVPWESIAMAFSPALLIDPTPAPEPSIPGLFGPGVVLLWLLRRRGERVRPSRHCS